MSAGPRAGSWLSDFGRNGWTWGWYRVFRMVLGTYLAVHFAHLIPFGAEVFSSEGMLALAERSPFVLLFPNVLGVLDSPRFVAMFLGVAVAASVAFAAGWRDRWAAVFLWYALACLFGRNPLTANPSLPFVGWVLLAHACIPGVPRGAEGATEYSERRAAWRFPPSIFAAAWIVMSLGYTYSGCMKLASPSWMDGSAMSRVLENPLARPTALREWVLSMPAPLKLATWGGLGLEIGFAPLVLVRALRPWLWGAMVAMHLSILSLVGFADLTMGMVMVHLFTFDPAWLARPVRAWRTRHPDAASHPPAPALRPARPPAP